MAGGIYGGAHTITDKAQGYNVVGVHDYNRDGADDVALRNGARIAEWTMAGGAFAGGQEVYGALPGNFRVV